MFFKVKKKVEIPFKAYSGAEPYVFVSYAHADSGVVYPIIKQLYNYGTLMWYDEGIDAGEEWPQKIADRILHCSKFILFVSPAAINSNHVRQEINFANSKHKQILPVYIKPTQLSAGLEMTLSVFQSIFYYAQKSSGEGFYKQLGDALAAGFVAKGEELTRLLEPSTTLLKLDEYGDKSLPPVIHLPDCPRFSVGRFDVSVGVKQSDFEFDRATVNVSRRHAVFEQTPQGYTVTDIGSAAGTWVNGKKLAPQMPAPLENGFRVSFGNAGANYIFEC